MTQIPKRSRITRAQHGSNTVAAAVSALGILVLTLFASSCSGGDDKRVQASGPSVTVGVTKVVKKSLGRVITLSSELVPFQ